MNELLISHAEAATAETNLSPPLPLCSYCCFNCRRIHLLNDDTFVHSFAYNHNNHTLQDIVVVVSGVGNIRSIIMLH